MRSGAATHPSGGGLLTTLLRAGLAGTLRPFVFEAAGHSSALDLDVPNLGAYVHVPFCETLCPFCPYYRVEHGDGSAVPGYVDALVREVEAVLGDGGHRLTSVYFGGGSPALAGEGVGAVLGAIRRRAEVSGEVGVELHPRDVIVDTIVTLRDAGVTMASLGVQSFLPRSLEALGRPGDVGRSERALEALAGGALSAVDVDLIFGIPGQSEEDLARDFTRAVELGATQVSTYPFIDFSYARNAGAPAPESRKRGLMLALLAAARDADFERGSVWTFRRRGTPAYSSVTRDNFVGFGASATTLLRDEFKVNVFDVDRYVAAAAGGRTPTAYTLRFTPRARRAYWLFWACYNLDIGRETFRELFDGNLDEEFGRWLALARMAGIAERTPRGHTLTARGAYLYHVVEQIYTHQYIDRTWRAAMSDPPPARILLW